jgi:catechol 2,3-dioxygenase-like lactoylglutathione lyase family enzyme
MERNESPGVQVWEELNMNTILVGVMLTMCISLSYWSEPAVQPLPMLGAPSGSFCALLVSNAKETADWYRDYLGFSITRSSEGPSGSSRTIMLEQHGALLEIIEARDSFNLQAVTQKKADLLTGIRKFGWVIEGKNFDALHSALVGRKAIFIGGVYTDDGLKMRSFIVQDNSGNLVQLFARSEP